MKKLVYWMSGVFVWATTLAIILLGLATFGGFLNDGIRGVLAWPFDLMSHFRLQYLVMQLVFMLVLLLLFRLNKRLCTGLLVINTLCLALNAALVIPYYLPDRLGTPALEGTVRILHMNLLGTNRRIDRVAQRIEEVQPDMITLQEYNTWWRESLENSVILARYPYRFSRAGYDDALYSKRPFKNLRVDYLTPGEHLNDSSIVAQFQVGRQTVTLLTSHPPIPNKPDLFPRYKAHFRHWVEHYRQYGPNLLMIGDLNTTPWSYEFQSLLAGTDLRDSQRGFGLQRSYPVESFTRRIPIDHCLVSPKWVVLKRRLGGEVGSDHFPLVVELGLKKSD